MKNNKTTCFIIVCLGLPFFCGCVMKPDSGKSTDAVNETTAAKLEKRRAEYVVDIKALQEKKAGLITAVNENIKKYNRAGGIPSLLPEIDRQKTQIYELNKDILETQMEYMIYLEKKISEMLDGRFRPTEIEFDERSYPALSKPTKEN